LTVLEAVKPLFQTVAKVRAPKAELGDLLSIKPASAELQGKKRAREDVQM
jgi:hypothetical protein